MDFPEKNHDPFSSVTWSPIFAFALYTVGQSHENWDECDGVVKIQQHPFVVLLLLLSTLCGSVYHSMPRAQPNFTLYTVSTCNMLQECYQASTSTGNDRAEAPLFGVWSAGTSAAFIAQKWEVGQPVDNIYIWYMHDNYHLWYSNIDSPYINHHFIYNHCYIHLQVQGYGGSLAHPLLLHIAISLLTPVRPSTISFLDTFWRTFRNLCSRFLCISSRFLHRHHLRPLLSGFVTTFGLLGKSSTCSSTSHSPFSCWNKLSSSS